MGEEERFEIQPGGLSPEDEADEENAALVDRLRRMQWPTVDPELRQRSWERFQKMVAARRDDPDGEPDDAD